MKFEIKDNNGQRIITADKLIIDFEHQTIGVFEEYKNRCTEYIHPSGQTHIKSARLTEFEIEEFRSVIIDMWNTEITVEEKLPAISEAMGSMHVLDLMYKYHPEYSNYIERLDDEKKIWDLLMSLSMEAELLADEENEKGDKKHE